jgi:hypothetical protein
VLDTKPTWPGGGTVRFVSPVGHDYSGSLEAREEAGTPNVVGDIRAALVLLVKEALGADFMRQRNEHFVRRALARWQGAAQLELLGSLTASRLPIFSFRVRNGRGGYVHQQLVTRMLSDRFGIQARGGCACAGPYVHRLLDIGADESLQMRQAILDGREMEKPGFIRLNFSVLLPDEKADFILDSVLALPPPTRPSSRTATASIPAVPSSSRTAPNSRPPEPCARRPAGRSILHVGAAGPDPCGLFVRQLVGRIAQGPRHLFRKLHALAAAGLEVVGQREPGIQQVQPALAQRAIQLQVIGRLARALHVLRPIDARLLGLDLRDAVVRERGRAGARGGKQQDGEGGADEGGHAGVPDECDGNGLHHNCCIKRHAAAARPLRTLHGKPVWQIMRSRLPSLTGPRAFHDPARHERRTQSIRLKFCFIHTLRWR